MNKLIKNLVMIGLVFSVQAIDAYTNATSIKDLTKLMVLPEYYEKLDHLLATTTSHQTMLHFSDKPIETDASTVDYVREKMKYALGVESDADNIEFALSLALEKDKQLGGAGIFAEFGVGLGKSGNFIAQRIGNKILYGFDWYQGLPEDWRAPHFLKGTYALKPGVKIPPLPLEKNIELVVGRFKDVLPTFVKEKNAPILFLHIDCDLYSSTKEIFNNIKDYVAEGTIIVFDEFFNYDGWQDHELRAFQEFIRETGFSFEYVCYNKLHQQVTVKIVSLNKNKKADLVELIKVIPNLVLDIRYATTNNFTGKVVYPQARCFLLKDVAMALAEVQKELNKQGFGIKIFDGYRPLPYQKILWDIFPDKNNIADPAKGCNRNSGTTVDVTIIDLKTGQELVMPSDYNDMSDKKKRHYDTMSVEAKKHCKLLEDVMTKHGFVPMPYAWFYFNFKDCEDHPGMYPLLDISFEEIDRAA